MIGERWRRRTPPSSVPGPAYGPPGADVASADALRAIASTLADAAEGFGTSDDLMCGPPRLVAGDRVPERRGAARPRPSPARSERPHRRTGRAGRRPICYRSRSGGRSCMERLRCSTPTRLVPRTSPRCATSLRGPIRGWWSPAPTNGPAMVEVNWLNLRPRRVYGVRFDHRAAYDHLGEERRWKWPSLKLNSGRLRRTRIDSIE